MVLDKTPFGGGNSVKATSGINGCETRTQKKLGIEDPVKVFERDIAVSAQGLSANDSSSPVATQLQKTLAADSGPAVHWLEDYFGLDLSLASRLGGHSNPRTHRGTSGLPGMSITQALLDKLFNNP